MRARDQSTSTCAPDRRTWAIHGWWDHESTMSRCDTTVLATVDAEVEAKRIYGEQRANLLNRGVRRRRFGAVDNSRSRLRTRVGPNVGVAVATQAGRPGAGEGTMKAGQKLARLNHEGRMIGDLALSARRLRFSE
jgi:hypothetical protein